MARAGAAACSSSASRASRPTTARATTSPRTRRFADGRTGAEAAWDYGRLYRQVTQEALDEVHGPATGVVFGRSGWSGQQATGMLWGGDQASRLLVAAGAARLAADRRRQRLLQPLPRRRRLPRPAAGRALRARAAGALGAARRALAADAGPRPLPAGGLDLRRRGARPLPRGGAAARAPGALHPAPPPPPPRAAGCRSCGRSAWWTRRTPRAGRSPTPTSSAPRSGWRPVLDEGARSRRAYLPRGEWICWWTGERLEGGDWIEAEAPLGRIPIWVRSGSLDRHLPGGGRRARASARRIPSGRSRRRCGASRRWAAPRLGSRTGPGSAGGGRVVGEP